MPNFRKYDVEVEAAVDVDFDIDVDEFLDECDEDEIESILEYLKDKEYLKDVELVKDKQLCAAELEFVDALDKIYTKWNILSNEETDLIIKLAKRF